MRKDTMWRFGCLALAALAVTLALLPAYVDAQANRQLVVATVNLEKVINGLQEREHRQQRLQAFINEREAELQSAVQQFERARDALEAVEGTDAYRAQFEQAQRLQLRAQLEKEFSEQLVVARRAEVFADLFEKIRDATGRVASQRGYDIVLSTDETAALPAGNEAQIRAAMIGRRVLFGASQIDISDELLTLMNNEWSAGQGRR